jgi:hypothetical protein
MSDDNLPTYVSSLAKLAAATDTSERLWTGYVGRKGFPKKTKRGYDVQAILAWYRQFVLPNKKGGDGSGPSDLNTKRGQKIDEEIALLKLKWAKEMKTVADRAEVDSMLLHVATLQKTMLYQALEREFPPKCEGRTASEISLLGRELADRLCEVFNTSVESWKQAPATG